MKLSFLHILVNEFKSFHGEHQLPLDSFRPGLHYVGGNNQSEPRLGSNGCLVGGTMIDCPRDLDKYPKGIPVRNLVGKSFWTYSWSSDCDEMVLAKVKNVWCSGVRPVYRVKVTAYPTKNSVGIRGGGSGTGRFLPPCELVGTFDHPVMLCDGTWKRLGDLKLGDSVKSFYRHRVSCLPEFVGSEEVYDMEVAYTNNFIANGMVVHNSGKSTLMVDAVIWCLYGRTPDGLRNPDIRPWHKTRDTTRVGLLVEIDGERVPFMRTASPNAFTVDGKAVADNEFERLTGMSLDLCLHTLVVGQKQQLFFDLQPRHKMQLFVDVLHLDKWDQRSDVASKRVQEIEREHAQADGELMGVARQSEQTEKLLATASEMAGEWDDSQQARLAEAKTGLAEANKRYVSVKAKADKADLDAESAALDLDDMRKEIEGKQQIVADARADAAKLKERRKGKLDTIIQLTEELKAFGEADNCPVCGEPIRKGSLIAVHKKELRLRIADLQAEADAIRPQDSERKINVTIDQIGKLRTQLEVRRERMHAAEAEQKLYAPMAASENVKIAAYERDIAQIGKETNPHQEQISVLKRERNRLKVRDKELREELEILARAAERNKFWVKGFKDIRLLVIEDVLAELELTCNTMLAEVGLVDWQIRFAIEKETKAGTTQRGLNVLVLSPNSRDAVKWEAWSGGEGQRLRMVGALALSNVLLDHAGIQSDFCVLDEPTQHLSPEGVRDLCDFLAVYAERSERRIFYIDHMSVESSQFASTTMIEKDKNGSHIVRTARSG